MKFLISPAKTFNDVKFIDTKYNVVPLFSDEIKFLHENLEKVETVETLENFYHSSSKVADEARSYTKLFGKTDAGEAIFLYGGLVYKYLKAESLNKTQIDFLENHLYIISGFYGLLTPHTKIYKYRLEMKQKFKENKNISDLYKYWTEKLTKYLENSTKKDEIIVNLASNEYAKAINPKKLNRTFVNVDFKVFKNGKLKVLATYAKQSRGLMLRMIAENKIQNLDEIKLLDVNGFVYDERVSTENNLVFVR